MHRRWCRALLRDAGGWTAAGNSRPTASSVESVISAFENGERGPDFVEVVAVCEALGTSLDSFCCRWESMSEDLEGD